MIRTLRAYFLSRLLREKLLLLGFLGVAVILWASAFASRGGAFWRAQHNTSVALADQERWLARKDLIKTATERAVSQMDPNKTLDPANLSVVVSQLATEAGIKNIQRLGSGAAMSSGQFSINTLRLQIQNAEWRDFANFYQKLQERSPYVAITEITMRPVRGNPAQITAAMVVASFEIRH
jgi:hypothetical protein